MVLERRGKNRLPDLIASLARLWLGAQRFYAYGKIQAK